MLDDLEALGVKGKALTFESMGLATAGLVPKDQGAHKSHNAAVVENILVRFMNRKGAQFPVPVTEVGHAAIATPDVNAHGETRMVPPEGMQVATGPSGLPLLESFPPVWFQIDNTELRAGKAVPVKKYIATAAEVKTLRAKGRLPSLMVRADLADRLADLSEGTINSPESQAVLKRIAMGLAAYCEKPDLVQQTIRRTGFTW